MTTQKTPELSDAAVMILLKEHARLQSECDRQRIAIEELKKECKKQKIKFECEARKNEELTVEKGDLEKTKESEDRKRFEEIIRQIKESEKAERFDRYRYDPQWDRNYWFFDERPYYLRQIWS